LFLASAREIGLADPAQVVDRPVEPLAYVRDIRAWLEANDGRPASPGAPSSTPPASPRCA